MTVKAVKKRSPEILISVIVKSQSESGSSDETSSDDGSYFKYL